MSTTKGAPPTPPLNTSPRGVDEDLSKLRERAFASVQWLEPVLVSYHKTRPSVLDEDKVLFDRLYNWLFAPYSLWPFNICDVLHQSIQTIATKGRLSEQLRVMLQMLPEEPSDEVVKALLQYEQSMQTGSYEHLTTSSVKFTQAHEAVLSNPELQNQWLQIKTVFDVPRYADHKGVIRRTMSTERNLRSEFRVRVDRTKEVFQAAFDAFCLHWHLYGMKHDEPLLLKLAVTITPYGTMVFIPSYWSFDPKRDIAWDHISALHRIRSPKRQGAALAESAAERKRMAAKLHRLDAEVAKRNLRGQKRHVFLCDSLGLVHGTSPKRFARLRAEFPKS